MDAATRANLAWKKRLAEYQKPALDPAIDEALAAFVSRKKSEMADAWY